MGTDSISPNIVAHHHLNAWHVNVISIEALNKACRVRLVTWICPRYFLNGIITRQETFSDTVSGLPHRPLSFSQDARQILIHLTSWEKKQNICCSRCMIQLAKYSQRGSWNIYENVG